MSTENLPKDVGLCAKCSAKNSKHATKCHTCGEILPWAAAKVKAPKAVAQGVIHTSAPKASAPSKAGRSISNPLDSIDIGGTIAYLGLWLGVFVLSSMCLIGAYFLYRHFDNEESSLRYAAAAGFWFVLLSFMTRMFLIREGVDSGPEVSDTTLFFFLSLF